MAWSSTSASGDQTPTSPAQSGSPSPGDGCGAGAVTFAKFLAQRRQYGGSGELQLPNVLLVPAPCGHCQKIEDLRRDWNTYSHSDGSAPQHHGLTVMDLDGSLANQIAFEGNSCFTCVKMIFDGRDTTLHYAARSGNLRMLFHLLCLLGYFYGHEGAVAVLALRKLNGRGETALHEAIRLGTSKCMVGMLMWGGSRAGAASCSWFPWHLTAIPGCLLGAQAHRRDVVPYQWPQPLLLRPRWAERIACCG